MKKSAVVLFFSVCLSLGAFAQTVQEGVSHLYAERTASAKSTFEKILAANPNNIEAVYWLGQTHLENNQNAEARNVYAKLLSTNGNAPLVVAGMGHVLLAEGKTAEARQQFEQAITLSRGKKGDDPAVLNAIGRANVEVREGDVAYALSKLQQATQLAPNNGDIWINLGNAYRRKGEGGEAVKSYIKAQASMPAVALYRQARVYETQRNWDVVTEHLNRAIQADPKFAPAYLRHYTYNLFTKQDFNAANEWAQKYVAVADPSIQNDVFKGQAAYLQKNYDEAINIGNRIIQASGKESAAPGVYRMMAYSYLDGKKDTATARRYADMLFANSKPDQRVARDYTLKATIYSKEDPTQVVNIYLDALEGDTTLGGRAKILQEAIDWAKTNNRKVAEAELRMALYRINPNANPSQFFPIGLAFYQGGSYQKADSAFQAYSRANPDSVFGYLWSARALGLIDSTGKQGLAIPQYEQLLRVAGTDKVRFKSYGVEASGMLANYYVNEKGDREKGVEYLNKGLEFDPGNQAFTTAIDRLTKKPAAAPRAQQPAKSGSAQGSKTKPKSGK
ncbi:tetratricopeptide repeat protein [Flaviaesturariibacter amylovorans]|uniref:Tetratricopeptide repeat protein n=1 Tax=Flaviaesturariibacter amylovorans TaxID=1084520 RepID=A0ABP8HAQ3_9BACT